MKNPETKIEIVQKNDANEVTEALLSTETSKRQNHDLCPQPVSMVSKIIDVQMEIKKIRQKSHDLLKSDTIPLPSTSSQQQDRLRGRRSIIRQIVRRTIKKRMQYLQNILNSPSLDEFLEESFRDLLDANKSLKKRANNLNLKIKEVQTKMMQRRTQRKNDVTPARCDIFRPYINQPTSLQNRLPSNTNASISKLTGSQNNKLGSATALSNEELYPLTSSTSVHYRHLRPTPLPYPAARLYGDPPMHYYGGQYLNAFPVSHPFLIRNIHPFYPHPSHCEDHTRPNHQRMPSHSFGSPRIEFTPAVMDKCIDNFTCLSNFANDVHGQHRMSAKQLALNSSVSKTTLPCAVPSSQNASCRILSNNLASTSSQGFTSPIRTEFGKFPQQSIHASSTQVTSHPSAISALSSAVDTPLPSSTENGQRGLPNERNLASTTKESSMVQWECRDLPSLTYFYFNKDLS